jgi:hypothetical protein
MRRRVFPLVIISLLTLICLVTALRTPRLAQGSVAFASQDPQQSVGKEVPESCPVTKPPANPFVPPVPYPVMTGPHNFWFGTEKLWTLLPRDGTWAGLGHYSPTDTAFRQKLFWWREGYDWHNYQPPLKVTGKRIDSPAPPLATDEHANGGWTDDRNHPFIVVGIDIPTLGCWKITGRFEDGELNFVIWVTQ